MKRLLFIAIAMMAFGCNPDQKLVDENEQLTAELEATLKMADMLKEETLLSAAAAKEAQAMAQESAEEARKMALAANEELEKLKKQLENCK